MHLGPSISTALMVMIAIASLSRTVLETYFWGSSETAQTPYQRLVEYEDSATICSLSDNRNTGSELNFLATVAKHSPVAKYFSKTLASVQVLDTMDTMFNALESVKEEYKSLGDLKDTSVFKLFSLRSKELILSAAALAWPMEVLEKKVSELNGSWDGLRQTGAAQRVDELEKMFEEAGTLNNAMLERIIEWDLSTWKDVIQFTNKSNLDAELSAVMANLANSKHKELLENFKELATLFGEVLTKLKSLGQFLDMISGNQTMLIDFPTKYGDRSFISADLMSDSIFTLEDFRKYPEQINANRTLQMTDLFDLWNLPYHSEHFGCAVAALVAVGNFEEKRTDPASKKRVQSLQGSFQTTTSEVQDLLSTVKDRMDAIRRPSRFARYTDRSDEVGLKRYQDVLALDQLLILHPNFQDLHDKKASLKELSALDLDFVEFHQALFRIPLTLCFLDIVLEFKRTAFSSPPRTEPTSTLCGCTLDNSASTVCENGQRGRKKNLFSRMVKQFKKMVRTAVMEKKMENLEKTLIAIKKRHAENLKKSDKAKPKKENTKQMIFVRASNIVENMVEINNLRESNRERRRSVKNKVQEKIDAMARFQKENDDIARANEYKYNKNDDVDMYFYDPDWFLRNGFSTDAAFTVPRVKMDINKTVLQGYCEWQLQKPGLIDDDLRVDRMGMCTMYPEMPLIRHTLAIDRHDEIRCCYHANIIIFPIYGRAIACMAPSGRTKVPYRDDIWLMITENRCKIIVMLCNLVEDGVVKCYPYFPDVIGRTKIFNGSKVTLDSQVEKFDGELIIRQITYQPVNPDIPKWKEGSIAKTENQLEAVRFVYYATRRKSRTVPYVVHSSRGTGRVCCFAAIDYIYQASCSKRRKWTLPRLVLQMRVIRYMAIETAEQLQFSFLMAYEAVVRKINLLRD
ncbi:unnamed protein product [Caenorhabditis sp. 36 PRJEB53466]|nr:unnamed protein product [Caenorhabditis sp. 36 PRJEB53466]